MGPDSQTNFVYRFVDTSSRADIIGFKHAINNLPGTEVPKIEIKILTSSTEDAQPSEWQQIAYINEQTPLLFLRDVKRYIKFVVEFSSSSVLTDANFLLLVQIQIEDIISPVISDHTRSILDRFPSWTKIFSDSLERATPELALPETTAGKFVNALVGDSLDTIDEFISRIELDSFIDSANENEIAWLYMYTPVSPGFIKVLGDNVELARVSTMKELLEHRVTDYVFFYNFTTGQLYTVRSFAKLLIDNTEQKTIPVQTLNSFDEFGLKVGLQRLYLESNTNFAKRILDVGQNPPAINEDGLKLTLRRELDIWRAVGATPNSDYQGATPEIIEIFDMNTMSKYFSKEGIPTKEFYDFVEYININYPTNLGYIKWGEAYWDYAGRKAEGISSIPQITDSATPEAYINIYQPGIGDFEDAKIKLEKVNKDIAEYSFGLRVSGIKYDEYENAYEPISIEYDTYLSYLENYVDNAAATVNYDVTLKLNLHGSIPNDAVYKARYTDVVKNLYTAASSPEYIVRPIFNGSGFTTGESIYYNSGGTPYINNFDVSATESYTFSEIPLYAVDEATISFINSTNYLGANGNYAWVGFVDATPYNAVNSSSTKIVKTAAQINDSPYAMRLRVGSNIYDPLKTRTKNTPVVRSSKFGLKINDSNDITKTSSVVFTPQDVLKDIIVPNSVTPLYVHIENVVEDAYDVDHSSGYYSGYGGVSLNRDTNEYHLLSASPNIIFSFVNPNFSTPQQMPNYIDTTGATANYYFKDIKFPYNGTPDYLVISSANSDHYPFNSFKWEKFTADYTSNISFYLGENGVISDYSTVNYDLVENGNNNLVGIFDFERSDFGLGAYASNDNLVINKIEAIDENDNVTVVVWHEDENFTYYTDDNWVRKGYNPTLISGSTPNGFLNYLDPNTGQYTLKNISIYAELNDTQDELIYPSINSGWYFQDGKEKYIYSNKKTETAVNDSTILLEGIARQGAPVLVVVENNSNGSTVNYTQVAFSNEATPTVYSHYNTEYITPTYVNYLALAYPDIFDVSVVDQFTGQTVIESEEFDGNIIDYTSSSTPLFYTNREYKVSYRVKNVFNIDNEYYNSIDNSYRSFVTLLSTPDYSYTTHVHYENSIFDQDYEVEEMILNPLISPIDEGFIYLSHSEYQFSDLEAQLSPNQVIQGSKDFMALNIWSKDVNENPKPYILVNINTPDAVATPSYVQTNEDGYARAYVKHTGAAIQKPTAKNIYLSDENEISSATVSYLVLPKINNTNKLSAEVTKKIINADGEEKQFVYGSATPNAAVYWRKARSLYEALNTPYSSSAATPGQYTAAGFVNADQNGNFNIGPYIAHNDATPGYWFVVVDSEFNQSPSGNPITIVGDIVYWYERYDVNQSNSAEPVLNAAAGSATAYYHYLTNPVFKKDQYTDKVYYESTSETSWNLPTWYPIDRYSQYQMGLFGSTPYIVDTYNNLRPDYEEE